MRGHVVDGRDGWEAVVPPFRVDVTHSARTLKSHRGSRRLEANVRYWRGCLTLALASGATETSQQSPATELRRLEHRAKAPVSGAAAPARQVAHLRPGYRCPGAARAPSESLPEAPALLNGILPSLTLRAYGLASPVCRIELRTSERRAVAINAWRWRARGPHPAAGPFRHTWPQASDA
jgi:hypothetical protein